MWRCCGPFGPGFAYAPSDACPAQAKLLARCLRANDTVMTLRLRGCYVRSYGAEMLGQVLRVNDRLTELDLRCGGPQPRNSPLKNERLLIF